MGILAVILAILAVLCAALGTFLFGTTGLIAACVLAAAAIVLGFLKRRREEKGGIAAIVIAVLAIAMAFPINNLWSGTFQELHKKAVEIKPDGLWAQVSTDTTHGMMGLISNIPTDDASLNELMDEMNELQKLTDAQP